VEHIAAIRESGLHLDGVMGDLRIAINAECAVPAGLKFGMTAPGNVIVVDSSGIARFVSTESVPAGDDQSLGVSGTTAARGGDG
jgi:hypothetical protein